MDFVMARLGNDEEAIIGLFDGVSYSNGGSRIAKYLQESFRDEFEDAMKALGPGDTPEDALRRTFLTHPQVLSCAGSEWQNSHAPLGRMFPSSMSSLLPPRVHHTINKATHKCYIGRRRREPSPRKLGRRAAGQGRGWVSGTARISKTFSVNSAP